MRQSIVRFNSRLFSVLPVSAQLPHRRRSILLAATVAASSSAITFVTASAAAMASPPLPKPPFHYLTSSDGGPSTLTSRKEAWADLTSRLKNDIASNEDRWQRSSARSQEIQSSLIRAGIALESSPTSPSPFRSVAEGEGGMEEEDELRLNKFVLETVRTPEMYKTTAGGCEVGGIHPRAELAGNLSWRMEEYATHAAFRHFLATGTLLSPSALVLAPEADKESSTRFLSDEEYLGGACIGLCQRLAKYGVGRATDLDVPSVQIARDVTAGILEQLLLFDFRNGPLRRKYDGTKYALKTLETLLYELSVTGAVASTTADGNDGAISAGDTIASETDERIPTGELAALRERMDRRDEQRELLIKKCRDGQKAAKQAIYADHRGDLARVSNLLQKCEECIKNDLLPIVHEEPGLRYGSFSNVLEEYVEARLFHAWLHGKEKKDDGGNDSSERRLTTEPSGTILGIDELTFPLEPDVYLGGLCDLTGEIGRYAVARGTARDKKSVRLCLETNKSILTSLQLMGKLPGNTHKKMSALRNSVEKLERIVYELSLMEASGRRYASAIEEVANETQNGDDAN